MVRRFEFLITLEPLHRYVYHFHQDYPLESCEIFKGVGYKFRKPSEGSDIFQSLNNIFFSLKGKVKREGGYRCWEQGCWELSIKYASGVTHVPYL